MDKIIFLVLSGCIALCTATGHDITGASTEVLFRVGKTVVLDCKISLHSKLNKYYWTKNGTPLTIEPKKYSLTEKGELSIKNSQVDDEGLYRCFADTAAGIASSSTISLERTFLDAPKVKSRDHKVIEGKPYSLPCPIPNSYPKPTITWKKQNGSVLSEDFLDRRALSSPDGTLWFTYILKQDVTPKEKYQCVATSPAVDGEVILAEHYMTSLIEDKNPSDLNLQELYLSKDITAKVGDATFIYCHYGGVPLTIPDWFKGDKNVNGDKDPEKQRVTRHNRSSGRRLLIKETLPEDEGSYTCKAVNKVSKPKSHNIRLTVVSAPKFTKKPEPQVTGKEGQDIIIPCQVTAVPAAKVTWTYNARPLIKNNRFSVNSEGLTIKKGQKGDKGYYGCRAVNEHGENYAESLVTV